MDIIVCMTIDVEEVMIGLLEKCMMRYVQIVVRQHRFLSSRQAIDRFTAGNAIRREDHKGIDDPDLL